MRGSLIPGSSLTPGPNGIVIITIIPRTDDAKRRKYFITRDEAIAVSRDGLRVGIHKYDEQMALRGFQFPGVERTFGYAEPHVKIPHQPAKTVVFGVREKWDERGEAIIIKHYIHMEKFRCVAKGRMKSAEGTIYWEPPREGENGIQKEKETRGEADADMEPRGIIEGGGGIFMSDVRRHGEPRRSNRRTKKP